MIDVGERPRLLFDIAYALKVVHASKLMGRLNATTQQELEQRLIDALEHELTKCRNR